MRTSSSLVRHSTRGALSALFGLFAAGLAASAVASCSGADPASSDGGVDGSAGSDATFDGRAQPGADAGGGADTSVGTDGATTDAREGGSDGGIEGGPDAAGTDSSVVVTDAAASSTFHAYVVPSALSVVTGGTLSFTGAAVGGSGNYSYAWTFSGTPTTATGVGPHTVTFTVPAGGTQPVTLTVTDTSTGDVWTQRTYVMVSTTAVNGLTVSTSQPAGGAATVEQGGALEIAGQGASTWLVNTGSVSVEGVQSGNVSGAYVPFPFAGTFTPGVVGGGSPLANTGTATANITVTAEPAGTLATGLRLGPLMGVRGCYNCDAYDDNRVAVRLATNRAGKYLAVFDQRVKAVDADDSIVAALYDGATWSPWVDIDSSTGKGVSAIKLGEGNPERQHQFDANMAANGDAAVVFMQSATAVSATTTSSTNHVWANVYRTGTGWTGPVRLDTEPDNFSNGTRDPRVVVWREGGTTTRALAVWRRHPNYAGLDRLDFATYSSATGTWSAAGTVPTGTSNNGYDSYRLAATPSGRVFIVWQDGGSGHEIFGGTWESGTWSNGTTALFTLANGKALLDLAASANGSAMAMIANTSGSTRDSVYAMSHNGTAWQAAIQIGNLTDIDTLVPDTFGTGYRYQTVADVRVAVDDAGNALAAWLPEITTSTGSGGAAIGVSSYRPAGGSWSAFTPFTAVASNTDFETVRAPSSSGVRAEIGLALVAGQGIVTYPISASSFPSGTYADQLYARRFATGAGTWSARALVDAHTGQKQGHSRVALEADGTAMTVYETWPAGSVAAGAVYGRKIAP